MLLYALTTGDVVGADFVEAFRLPAGLGDVAIMEIMLQTSALATKLASLVNVGGVAQITTGSAVADIVGEMRWANFSVSQFEAYISPDPLVLWRQDEFLQLSGPELDTNAAPTGDLVVLAKVVRVRPLEGAAAGPIRLVR